LSPRDITSPRQPGFVLWNRRENKAVAICGLGWSPEAFTVEWCRERGMEQRGHDVVVTDDWANGKVMSIRYDKARGIIQGGVSPRRQIGYALGW